MTTKSGTNQVEVETNKDRYLKMTGWVKDNDMDMLPDLHNLSSHDYLHCDVNGVAVAESDAPSSVAVERTPVILVPWMADGCESTKALKRLVANGMEDITDLKGQSGTFPEAMDSYPSGTNGDYSAIYKYCEKLESDEERWENQQLIWKIAKLALRAEELITKPLHLLDCSDTISSTSITLSQEQCACLLANAFLGTFPYEGRRSFNMARYFTTRNYMALTKLKFIYHYFKLVTDDMPTGCVSFRRVRISENDLPQWKDQNIKIVHKLAVSDVNPIEDCAKFLQMDFANKFIGGGVLNAGAVMEEIRFLICPEMMVSMLLCPVMKRDEATFIAGAQRYSSYEGYSKSLKWKPFKDYGSEPRDKYGRVQCELVALDAKSFTSNVLAQYSEDWINRELNKPYAGFHTSQRIGRPIATGNWGCGVFKGNPELKSLIQLMAAGQAGRDMLYVPYDLTNQGRFGSNLNRVYMRLVQREVTIGQLYQLLVSYRPTENISVFDYVLRELS